MPRSIWTGVISFGMVSIPVKLYTATESNDIAFHQLHSECESRIKYQKWCPRCDRVVDNNEIERGFEFARGHYVVLSDQDFESIPLSTKHTIEVSSFVKSEQIDPVYYDKSYYLEPDKAAVRPLTLFMRSLIDMKMVALAAITIRNKERLCCLRPFEGTMIMETLLYPDEVRIGSDTVAATVSVSEGELNMARHLIELMQQEFDPARYHDHYREALKKVIDAKLEGKEFVVQPELAPTGKVVDLLEALRASVESLQSKGKQDQLSLKDEQVMRVMKDAKPQKRNSKGEENSELLGARTQRPSPSNKKAARQTKGSEGNNETVDRTTSARDFGESKTSKRKRREPA